MSHYVIGFFVAVLSLLPTSFALHEVEQQSLLGTTWHYTDNDHDWSYDVTFANDGRFVSAHPNDNTPDNDFWSQTGDSVFFEYNDGYAKYSGKFKSSDLIIGIARNQSKSWKWKLRRFEEPEA